MKPLHIHHKFHFKGSRSTIYIAPSMVESFLEAIEQLEEDSGLPLSTYSIVPNLYVSPGLGYIMDEEGNVHVIGFTDNLNDFLNED